MRAGGCKRRRWPENSQNVSPEVWNLKISARLQSIMKQSAGKNNRFVIREMISSVSEGCQITLNPYYFEANWSTGARS